MDRQIRSTRECGGLTERRYQYYWCDGFMPLDYFLENPSPRITGKVWICNGPEQTSWDFTLFLPCPAKSRDDIDWGRLYPAQNVTRWMSFDERRQHLEIEPAIAEPDLAEPANAPYGRH